VPGGNARSVTVDITNDGPMEYWVHPGTGFQDPSIWDRRTADGGVDFSVPAGPPTGRGNLGITIPNNGYLFPDPSNPQNLGTTIQIYMSALPGQALNAGISIVHDCVSSGDG
jgi:hypothetical protein